MTESFANVAKTIIASCITTGGVGPAPTPPHRDVTVTMGTQHVGQRPRQRPAGKRGGCSWRRRAPRPLHLFSKCHHPLPPPGPIPSHHPLPSPREPAAICARRKAPQLLLLLISLFSDFTAQCHGASQTFFIFFSHISPH